MAAASQSLRALVKQIPGAIPAVRLLRRLTVPHERYIYRLKNDEQSGLLQHSPMTIRNRYPTLFQFVANDLENIPAPKVLSFGCSTGEEVFTLVDYVPHGTITGIDINPYSIKKCRKDLTAEPKSNVSFKCTGSVQDELDEYYDAIFCLAVTRHPDLVAERPDSCEQSLPFEKFDTLMRGFCRILKPGGLLVIWNSQFRFSDCGVAQAFKTVCRNSMPPQDLLYGSDNRRIDGTVYDEAIFRKHPLRG